MKRNLALTHKQIEMIEAALRNQAEQIIEVIKKQIFTSETKKIVVAEKNEIDDLLFQMQDGKLDV